MAHLKRTKGQLKKKKQTKEQRARNLVPLVVSTSSGRHDTDPSTRDFKQLNASEIDQYDHMGIPGPNRVVFCAFFSEKTDGLMDGRTD